MRPRERFASNLRVHRKRRGLSQEALGFRAGLHPTHVSLIERSKRNVEFETIVKLARGLEIPAGDLFEGI